MPLFAALNTTKISPYLGAPYSNPGVDDTVVTTGALPAGKYLCQVTIGTAELTDSRAIFQVQRRNVEDDDGSVLEAVAVVVPFDTTLQLGFMFNLDADERVSVVSMEDLEGDVYASINYQRLA